VDDAGYWMQDTGYWILEEYFLKVALNECRKPVVL
jgi:hypothetical protein